MSIMICKTLIEEVYAPEAREAVVLSGQDE